MATQAYARTFNALRGKILAAAFPPGAQLPPERVLCGQYRVSRITIRHAMRLLEEQGLVERRQGKGTFVRSRPSRRITILTSDFPGSLRREAPRVVRRLLRRELARAPAEVAEALGLLPGERCLVAERINELDGEPLGCDRAWLPEALAGSADAELLARLDFLNAWMARERLAFSHCVQSIEAAAADAPAARLLGIRRGSPVLCTCDVIHVADGRAVARFDSVFRGDRFRLVSTLTVDFGDAHGH